MFTSILASSASVSQAVKCVAIMTQLVTIYQSLPSLVYSGGFQALNYCYSFVIHSTYVAQILYGVSYKV